MKAEEFRVGNQTNLGVVVTIYNNGFWVIGNDKTYHYSDEADIQPIPLTDEWLWKFGIYEYPYKVLGGVIKVRNGVYFFKCNGVDIEIKYVHTFQNFIFALTGEELTIKEP